MSAEICQRRGVGLEGEVIADTSPAVLPIWLRQIAIDVCSDLKVKARVMASGAGHDAQVVNAIVPAALLFVPSREGLSHVPEEWTSATDIARGVDVVVELLLQLDDRLRRWSTAGH